jgi:hypothetical protein
MIACRIEAMVISRSIMAWASLRGMKMGCLLRGACQYLGSSLVLIALLAAPPLGHFAGKVALVIGLFRIHPQYSSEWQARVSRAYGYFCSSSNLLKSRNCITIYILNPRRSKSNKQKPSTQIYPSKSFLMESDRFTDLFTSCGSREHNPSIATRDLERLYGTRPRHP